MVAAPTFTAPIGDRLTVDPIRSRQDSRITSSRGPLWMVTVDPETFPARDIVEAVADDMGTLIRTKTITFLREADDRYRQEAPTDVGGTSEAIWLGTMQPGQETSTLTRNRIYELSPDDFSVRRQALMDGEGANVGIDGDNDVVYVGITPIGSSSIRQLNAETFATLRSVDTWPFRAQTIAGDVNGCWASDWTRQELRKYTAALALVAEYPYPYADKGHRGRGIGGGSRRIYCETIVEEDAPNWRAGTYLHTLDPQTIDPDTGTYHVVRTYGPFVSGRAGALVGGM